MKRWSVYLHENRENGKKYIGITSQKPERRWANGEGYAHNPHFYRAIKKQGWDAFRHEILYTGLTQEEAERLEVELIEKYQTQDGTKGYNFASGGGAPTYSDETRAKMSVSAKKRGVSASVRAAAKAYWTGRHQTEETKAKLRAANIGRSYSPDTIARMKNSATKRRVQCVETGEIFRSLLDAQKRTGIDRTVISRCCAGKPHSKTAGGYHWRFLDAESIAEASAI